MNGIFQRALGSRQRVIIMYMDGKNQITHREVRVLKINEDYLLVYCFAREGVRTLKRSNILSARPVNERAGA
jgi:predicted DNA-binding transcriptional regulator YafY